MRKTEKPMKEQSTRKPYEKPSLTVVTLGPETLMAGSLNSSDGGESDTDSKSNIETGIDAWGEDGMGKEHGSSLWDDEE